MERLVWNDVAWERMAPLIMGPPDQKGSSGRDNRMFVEGVLWIVRTRSPWRDLPEVFGDWNSVFRRFSSRWLALTAQGPLCFPSRSWAGAKAHLARVHDFLR
jgi:putative transposase